MKPRMRTLFALLVLGAAIFNVACTDNGAAHEPQTVHGNGTGDEHLLLREIDQASTKCRSMPGDSTDGMAACEKRDRLVQEAEKAGWCWGPQESFSHEKHWIRCSETPNRTPKRLWFAHDLNHVSCIQVPSPADKIREIQGFGQIAKTSDLPSGTVEVEVDIGGGRSQVWTFYRTQESCETSLPRLKKIDGKYE
jgi:hypothetical protein